MKAASREGEGEFKIVLESKDKASKINPKKDYLFSVHLPTKTFAFD
jgi:hypothetical protein